MCLCCQLVVDGLGAYSCWLILVCCIGGYLDFVIWGFLVLRLWGWHSMVVGVWF